MLIYSQLHYIYTLNLFYILWFVVFPRSILYYLRSFLLFLHLMATFIARDFSNLKTFSGFHFFCFLLLCFYIHFLRYFVNDFLNAFHLCTVK